MDLDLNGKTALVTASSRGLGRACAAELAREGADVAICARGEEELRETGEHRGRGERQRPGRAVRRHGPGRRIAPDLPDRAGSRARGRPGGERRRPAQRRLPRLENRRFSASQKTECLREFTDEDWRDAFELTLLSGIRLARAVLPGMRDLGWGRVVFVTSLSVKEPLPGLVLSNAMRLGVTGLAKTLSDEYAADGVTVNTALPGYTLTDRMRDLFATDAAERGITLRERLDEVAADIPAGRLAEPEEFAGLVAFLCSTRASSVTGAAVQANGGYVGSPL